MQQDVRDTGGAVPLRSPALFTAQPPEACLTTTPLPGGNASQPPWSGLNSYGDQLRLLIEALPVRVFCKDTQSRYVWCNRLFAQDAGLPSPAAIAGRTDYELPWAREAGWFMATDRQVIESRNPKLQYEELQTLADGSLRNVRKTKVPLFNEDKEVIGLIGTVEDLTEWKCVQQQLTVSEYSYRFLFESNPNPMWVFDSETLRFLAVNNSAVLTYGWTREEFLELTLADIRPAEDIPLMQSLVARAGSDVYRAGAVRHRKKDGTVFWVEITTHSGEFEGRPAHHVLAIDVTEKLRAEAELRAQKEMFQCLADASPTAIFRADAAGRILYCNDRMLHMTGLSSRELAESDMEVWMHPDDAVRVRPAWREALARGTAFAAEFRAQHTDGRLVWLAVQTTPLRDDAGGVTGHVGTALNITHRQQTELALRGILRASAYVGRDFFRALVKELACALNCCHVSIAKLLPGPELSVRTLAVHCSIGRESSDYLIQPTPAGRVLGQSAPEFCVMSDDVQASFPEDWFLKKLGARSYIGVPLVSADGTPLGIIQIADTRPFHEVEFARDLLNMFAARAAAEVERWRLDKHQGRLLAIMEAAPDLIATASRDGSLLYMNQGGRRMLGIAPNEDIRKLRIGDTHTPAMNDRILHEVMPTATERRVWTGESIFLARDGREIPTSQTVIAHKDASGAVEFYSTIARDITETKRAQARLELQDAALSAAAQAIGITDAKGTILWVNRAFSELTGFSSADLIGQPICMLRSGEHTEEFFRAAWQTMLQGHVWRGEVYSRRKDGTVYLEELTATPVRPSGGDITHFIMIKQSVEERRDMERRVLRAQRLESIGTLAAGVAHDLNNALSPILMGSSMIREGLPQDLAPLLDTMENSARRGAEMVRQLLTFAKGAEGNRVLLQPRHLFREIEKIVTGTFPKNLRIGAVYKSGLHTILGDATQLHQVLLNLCVNARDAMPEGGELVLEAANVEVDATFASSVQDAKPGNYVVVRVCDTGPGIPPNVLERIFEPFFTTKAADKGTGLGLPTVLGIVKSHGGFVLVDTEIGRGSCFSVYLPAAAAQDGTELVQRPRAEFRGNGELVLVVDDEAVVREVSRTVLSEHNLRVVVAADGTEALVRALENRAELRAVITDMHMPHMDGILLLRALKHVVPGVPAIVVTGRLAENQRAELTALHVNEIIEKPHTVDQLLGALSRLLPPAETKR